MTAGLDLQQSTITVKLGDQVVPTTGYTLTTDAHGFVLTLLEDYVITLSDEDVVTVSYSAVINKDAAIDSATGNSNKATLKYSEQTAEDEVFVATYDFILEKTDGSKFLDGSGFKLYDADEGGNQIVVAKDDTGYYVDQSATKDPSVQIMVDKPAGVNVRGLAPGDYYLEETKTPDGYNTLTKRWPVQITVGAATVIVINQAGTELPSTGGMGTTILYTVGGILVLVAAVLLIARRRTEK
jgi:LPXTG-motif cell wall-anchored protein